MHMKPFLVTVALLLISLTGGHAASGISARASAETEFAALSVRHDLAATAPASGSQFAELNTDSHAPISSSMLLTLVAVLVVAFRLMGLNHARAMADHERDSYHGKARMFHALREDGANR
jgi:hypothetical protein